MRKGKEILNDHIKNWYQVDQESVIEAINEARIEAIKECADLVQHRGDRNLILDIIDQVK